MSVSFPLGLCPKSVVLKFSGTDTKDTFETAKRVMPPEWMWHTNSITYSYNSLGHRNDRELEEYDVSNTVAIVGCSHIEGTGNASNQTIPYYYSTLSGDDTYNIGQGGVDNEIIFYNALWAYQQGFKKIIVCWTQPERNFLFDRDGLPVMYRGPDIYPELFSNYFTPNYIFENPHWQKRIEFYTNILHSFGIHTFRYFEFRTEDSNRVWDNVWKGRDINQFNDFKTAITNISVFEKMFARDVFLSNNGKFSAHYGPHPNEIIAKDIIEQTK